MSFPKISPLGTLGATLAAAVVAMPMLAHAQAWVANGETALDYVAKHCVASVWQSPECLLARAASGYADPFAPSDRGFQPAAGPHCPDGKWLTIDGCKR
jgi:hypothetical protein